MTNRSEINRALAKALAYAECGKFEEAQRWGEALIRKLELAAVFKAGSVRVELVAPREPLAELQTMITAAVARNPAGKARITELKAIQWRLRGPCGQFVGHGDIFTGFRGQFVPEASAIVFDGRDNEATKLDAYSRDLGPLTVEIIPQLCHA
jgi:hypothetical protein